MIPIYQGYLVDLYGLRLKYYQNSEYYQKWVDGNTENVVYNQIFPVIKSNVIILPENFGFENRKINLEDKLEATFQNNLKNPDKEFELLNVISLRIIVAKTNKGHIEKAREKAEQLLVAIGKEIKHN